MKAFGTVRCPWCGAEFDTGGIEEAGACVVECDRCGCWDVDGFCGWGHAYECGVGACDVPDCPLGHPMARNEVCQK